MKKNLWKRFLGNCLFRVCNQYPTTKVVVAKWGMRCKKEWFENYVGNVQLPEGLTLKLASLGENYLSFQLFWHGTQFYEPVTTLILQELLRPGDTFFDVGANIGFYSLVLTRSRPQIRVVAFEPNPKVHRLLKENVAVNAFNQITCEPLALSDADGAATLFLSQSDHSASLCSDFEEEPAGVLEVPALRLDTYMNRLSPLSGRLVLKVDAEGNEAAVLAGALQTLTSIKPDIVVEVAQQGQRPAFLAELGYRAYSITDHGLLETSTWAPHVRGPFVFLNQLLTTRPPGVVADLFNQIKGRVRRVDLSKTSKLADGVVLDRALRIKSANLE
jgi:FkbM family methyltransferase